MYRRYTSLKQDPIMKEQIKKWTIRLTATGLLISGLLIGIVLNPSLLYANQTVVGNYTIYHNSNIDNGLFNRFESITSSLKKSELYDPTFSLDICLNDGSYYPTLLEKIRGKAFAWGFYNKVVLQGNSNYENNYVDLNGHHWNLEQLIAHEAIHCYQYKKFGFWGSNPMASYPNWKWEGYPEYISRQNEGQKDLVENIHRLSEINFDNEWAIRFQDKTISPINYYKDWILVQYSLDVKGRSYIELLNDPTEKDVIEEEMMNWYSKETKKQTHNN